MSKHVLLTIIWLSACSGPTTCRHYQPQETEPAPAVSVRPNQPDDTDVSLIRILNSSVSKDAARAEEIVQELGQVLYYAPTLYSLAAEATFLVSSAAATCYDGVAISFRNEIVLMTRAHCVRHDGQTQDIEIQPFVYYSEPPLPKDKEGWQFAEYAGYRSDDKSKIKIPAERLVVSTSTVVDLAYVRGLFPNGLKDQRQPLRLASTGPKRFQAVVSLHWQPHSWREEKAGKIEESPGTLLVPTFGVYIGNDWGGYSRYDLLPFYGGDSGSPFLNGYGALFGFGARTYPNKKNQIVALVTKAADAEAFLNSTWK